MGELTRGGGDLSLKGGEIGRLPRGEVRDLGGDVLVGSIFGDSGALAGIAVKVVSKFNDGDGLKPENTSSKDGPEGSVVLAGEVATEAAVGVGVGTRAGAGAEV